MPPFEGEPEEHPSWITIRANTVSGKPVSLFDSEILHSRYVVVEICVATRQRELNRDWIMGHKTIMEVAMSMAQWGAFVSSFGDGSGVPVTLTYHNGERIEAPPYAPRLAQSIAEVKEATNEATRKIQEDFDEVERLFNEGAGRKAMKEAIHNLHYAIENAPKNMQYAAKTLAEHTENVVQKARGDIEAMIQQKAEMLGLESGSAPTLKELMP